MGDTFPSAGGETLRVPLSFEGSDPQSLLPRVKGTWAWPDLTDLPFFPLLQQQDEVPGRERDPLVLQLDTFGETIGRIPVLRGPRLHVL